MPKTSLTSLLNVKQIHELLQKQNVKLVFAGLYFNNKWTKTLCHSAVGDRWLPWHLVTSTWAPSIVWLHHLVLFLAHFRKEMRAGRSCLKEQAYQWCPFPTHIPLARIWDRAPQICWFYFNVIWTFSFFSISHCHCSLFSDTLYLSSVPPN